MAMQKVMTAHQPRRLSGRAYTKQRKLMHSIPCSVTLSSYALIWKTNYEHHATTCCHLNVSLLDTGQVRAPRHFRGACVHILTSVADVFLSRGRRARSRTMQRERPGCDTGPSVRLIVRGLESVADLVGQGLAGHDQSVDAGTEIRFMRDIVGHMVDDQHVQCPENPSQAVDGGLHISGVAEQGPCFSARTFDASVEQDSAAEARAAGTE
jgi:hypothetical protein